MMSPHVYTVGQAVKDWLEFGLSGRDPETVATRRILATQHVIPALGARKLPALSAEDVDPGWRRKPGPSAREHCSTSDRS
ncbi:MAG: integrase [Pseudonocardia sp.]|jgi:hypothetical protein|nr:integrase [Pseudonocardia sp.]